MTQEEFDAFVAVMPRTPISLEDASPSLLCSEGGVVTGIPLCNMCKKWNGYGKCKQFGTSPEIYKSGESRDCPAAVLNPDGIGFSRFCELYPEDVERLLKRQP